MNELKRIIILRGVENTGKSTKINQLADWIVEKYKIEYTLIKDRYGDIHGILKIENLAIGFNSSGDWITQVQQIEKLKNELGVYPDIIICASRTRGCTHDYFNENFGYSNGWLKVYHTVKRFQDLELRNRRDKRIVEEVQTRLIGLRKN